MLLKLCGISRFYGPRLVFRDVSLEVPAGAVMLLAGPNGAGKSTLLKIMAGLIRPSSGEILFQDDAAAPLIGYLGHQTFIYPDLTALENLRFWTSLSLRGVSDKTLRDILDRVELAPFAEEKAKGFSRGMAQRLNLARVFLLRPDILLLDEPGTGLDTRSTAVLHREIARAREEGAGIVWITHHLEDDMQRADLVALLENKRLGFYGPVEEYRARRDAVAPAPEPAESRRAGGGEPC